MNSIQARLASLADTLKNAILRNPVVDQHVPTSENSSTKHSYGTVGSSFTAPWLETCEPRSSQGSTLPHTGWTMDAGYLGDSSVQTGTPGSG